MWTSGEKRSELTASTRPFTVGVFSMRASNTSSVSLRTYSRTAKAGKCGQLYGHSCTNCKPSFLETKINQKVKSKSSAKTFMWQMIWYVFLMHAFNDFVSHMLFPVVGVAAHVYKHRPVPPPSSPFTQKTQRDWAASQAITGNTVGSFSDVDSPEYTDYKHYILFQNRRVDFGERFGWIDTNTHPPTQTHTWLTMTAIQQANMQGQRETRHRVGRASSLQWPFFPNPTDVWLCILCWSDLSSSDRLWNAETHWSIIRTYQGTNNSSVPKPIVSCLTTYYPHRQLPSKAAS